MRKNKGSSFHDRFWPFTTYFAEGFPYSIIRSVSAVFFRDMKVALEAIGLTPLYGLPWVLKFLWAPQVDSTATKRRWIFLTELLLVGLFFFSSFAALLPGSVKIIAILFFVGAALSGWQGNRFRWSVERGPRVSAGQRLALAFVGGFVAAWGAKIAKGCTSGQALTGGSLLNVGSLVFMLAVFAGAYGFAYFLRKEWL